MDDIERRISARSFARLVGEWRPPDGRRLAAALADRIRLLVLDGRLPLQTRVPAERELAMVLGISRTTVAAAYDGLRDAQVLHSRRGAGSWTQLPDARGEGGRASPFSPGADRSLFDLAHAVLPAPADQLRAAAAGAVHDLDAMLGGHGLDLLGLPALRSAIAARYTVRGLPTIAEQVLVTGGAQHAITLALTALTAPGDRVLVEHPTYPNTLHAIATRGARPVPVPMTEQPAGWDLDLITAAVRDAAPRLAYVIPDFQNPTGALLDDGGRAQLVDLARRTGTTLVVDETLTELALTAVSPTDAISARPLPVAAYGAADSAQVLTVGSASKVFWGGLRVGWIRTSASMVRRLGAQRAAMDLGSPALEQLVVTRLLSDVDSIVAQRRAELIPARDHLIDLLAAAFPRWHTSRPGGGLSLWVELDEPMSSRLAVAARRHDVLLAAGPRFGVDGAFERRLRLPYTLRPDRLDAAVDRLVLASRGLDHAGTGVDTEPVAVA